MEQRALAPLMIGHEYVLAEPPLADFLEALHLPQFSASSAIIYDPRRQQEIPHYRQLHIRDHFGYRTIYDLDLNGERMLLMDAAHVFVSPALKQRLEGSAFDYLRFSKGLTEFGAVRER